MNWYEEDVRQVLTNVERCTYVPKTIFYGSSTFTLWDDLNEDFSKFAPINLGFGGSTLAACTWYFEKIVGLLAEPETFILYAGDNDLGDGRLPEEICLFFRQFIIQLRERFKDAKFYFISIKPSISREGILNRIVETNKLIKQEILQKNGKDYFVNIYDSMIDLNGKPARKYFKQDGLHLNKKGYQLWKETILKECLLKNEDLPTNDVEIRTET